MTTIPVDDEVWLRPLGPDDVPDVVAAVRDPAIVRFIPRIPAAYGPADADAFIAEVAPADGQPVTTFALAVRSPDHPRGRVAGCVGIRVDPDVLVGEVGYWTAPEVRGRGHTARAVHALCAHGFDALELERLFLQAAVDNAGSNAIARRLGFTQEGRLRAAHRYRDAAGRPTGRGDMWLWGLLPGELRAPEPLTT